MHPIRIEKKEKRMATLLEISILTEQDRHIRQSQMSVSNETEPSKKKSKIASMHADPIQITETATSCTQTSPDNSSSTVTETETLTEETQTDLSITTVIPIPMVPATTTPPPSSPEDNKGEEKNAVGPSGKVKVYKENYAQLRKVLRERANYLKSLPNFCLRDVGTNAHLNISLEHRVPIFFSDLQHLIMYSQLGHHAPYSPARWCSLKKFNKLSITTILIIENMTLTHYQEHENLFPFLNTHYEYKLEVLSPYNYNCDLIKEISLVPLTGSQMNKYIYEYGNLENAVLNTSNVFDTLKDIFPITFHNNNKYQNVKKEDLPASDNFSRTLLLLSGWQMIEENFPLPIKGLMERKYSSYVMTKDKYDPVTPTSKLFGLDCEMCKTDTGDLELTRISLVDEDLNVFYDTLVKPDNKIIDYLTKYSGITYKMMKNVNKRLVDVQEDIRRILPNDAILVGQSISNDLHALKMMHPYIIDTSIIFNITGDRSRKTRLQTLAREFLFERIQEKRSGHCSTEDSLASLKLAKLKLRKNISFGDAVMSNVQNDRIQPELGTVNYATSLLQLITKNNKNALVVGFNDATNKYKYCFNKCISDNNKVTCKSVSGNKDIINTICSDMRNYSLCIGHIKLNNNQLNGTKIYKSIDKWVRQINEDIHIPGFSMIIFSGNNGANGTCFINIKKQIQNNNIILN